MSQPVLAVIGGLSTDKIHLVTEFPGPGQLVNAETFQETGGRAANIAIAAHRSSHSLPDTTDHLYPIDDDDIDHMNPADYPDQIDPDPDTIIPDIRVIAAVSHQLKDEFSTLLRRNGLSPNYLRAFDGAQAEVYAMVERGTGRARQTMGAGVEQCWEPDDFDTPEKLGGGVRPDLVVVTMDMQRAVVETIISTAHEHGIDTVLYASPAKILLTSAYSKLTHIVVDESDAGDLAGYTKVTVENWSEISNEFTSRLEVANVVLKLGPYGAYYKNSAAYYGDNAVEDYASGYTKIREIADLTGSTGAFVGAYALEYLKSKFSGEPWYIRQAVMLGNRVCARCDVDIGCLNATPWKDQLDESHDEEIWDSLETLMTKLTARKKKRAAAW